ncbi:MAG: sugar transferase [Bacteroidia bacterium]|nr:sugar transferase [Bacteroidia bacterium]
MKKYISLSDDGLRKFLEKSSDYVLLTNENKLFQKRIIDVVLSFMLLIVLMPLIVFISILVKITTRGPIFYVQERVGKNNIKFNIWKFRSMRVDAEKDGPQWASKNDCRVTPIGNFIRKTRIDELPQLINVLSGSMSLVGPRPEREVFINQLIKQVPEYNFRHRVKPGVTGWAQVNYPYGATVEDAIWKHKYDLYYIKNYSFLLDLKIIFMTVTTVLFGKGT